MGDRTLRFRDSAECRAWLSAHGDTEPEAVVAISKQGTQAGLHYIEALEEALCFGRIDGKPHAHDATTFLPRFTPRKPDSIWSKSNRERVSRLIRDGRMTAAGQAKIDKAK